VAVPASVFQAASDFNITIDFNTTEVFVVEEPGKLEDTIGAAALAGEESVIIVLGPGLYPLLQNYVLTTNVVIVAETLARRRMLRSEHGQTLSSEPVVIYATQGSRHFIMSGATLYTDNVILQGAPTGLYSGGVELQDGAMGLFIKTAFLSCRTAGEGGALQLTGGSTCTIGSGAVFADNVAAQGGAIHVASGCTVQVNNTVSFTNNSAPRTSPTAGGGGAIWVGSGASVQLDYAMTFAGNLNDDVTVAGGVVTCADPLYQTNCAAGCTGSYDIPASCPICSAGGACTSCPQGTFGGASVALVCQLCPFGFTTIYPPSSTSSSACVPITQSPTFAPTVVG
jgi:predicted outer membrane repeat protein